LRVARVEKISESGLGSPSRFHESANEPATDVVVFLCVQRIANGRQRSWILYLTERPRRFESIVGALIAQ
jgi:hypothetical protein